MLIETSSGSVDAHVEEQGAGAPVVLVHSSGMSSRQWRALAKALSSTHRTLVPDLLGCGATKGFADGAFRIEDDLAIVVQLARNAGGPVHLVGHSYGGMLALMAARALGPQLVPTLAVYEPVAWGVAFAEEGGPVRAAFDAFSDRFFDEAYGGTPIWYEEFVDFWNGPGTWTRLPEPQRAAFLAVGKKVFREVRDLCFERTPKEAYAAITAPTMILSGETTPPAEQRVCEVLAEVMPRAERVVFPGVGHMGPLVAADAVNAHIAAHVRGAGERQSP